MHLGIDFLRILMDSGGQVGAMRPPKRPKTPQLGAQDGPEAAQETPKTVQETPKSCPEPLQTKILKNVGKMFGKLGIDLNPEAPKSCPETRLT